MDRCKRTTCHMTQFLKRASHVCKYLSAWRAFCVSSASGVSARVKSGNRCNNFNDRKILIVYGFVDFYDFQITKYLSTFCLLNSTRIITYKHLGNSIKITKSYFDWLNLRWGINVIEVLSSSRLTEAFLRLARESPQKQLLTWCLSGFTTPLSITQRNIFPCGILRILLPTYIHK